MEKDPLVGRLAKSELKKVTSSGWADHNVHRTINIIGACLATLWGIKVLFRTSGSSDEWAVGLAAGNQSNSVIYIGVCTSVRNCIPSAYVGFNDT
jgi:hypothetical protein